MQVLEAINQVDYKREILCLMKQAQRVKYPMADDDDLANLCRIDLEFFQKKGITLQRIKEQIESILRPDVSYQPQGVHADVAFCPNGP